MIKLIDSDFISAPAAQGRSAARRPASRFAARAGHRNSPDAAIQPRLSSLTAAGSDFSVVWNHDLYGHVESRLTRYHE